MNKTTSVFDGVPCACWRYIPILLGQLNIATQNSKKNILWKWINNHHNLCGQDPCKTKKDMTHIDSSCLDPCMQTMDFTLDFSRRRWSLSSSASAARAAALQAPGAQAAASDARRIGWPNKWPELTSPRCTSHMGPNMWELAVVNVSGAGSHCFDCILPHFNWRMPFLCHFDSFSLYKMYCNAKQLKLCWNLPIPTHHKNPQGFTRLNYTARGFSFLPRLLGGVNRLQGPHQQSR